MSRRASTEVLRSVSVSTLVPTGARQTWQCVSDLVADLWRTEILISDSPSLLLHSVMDETGVEPDCWLTWNLAACGSGTRVVLVHSEQADIAPPELHTLLLVVLERCIKAVTTS